MYLSIEGDRGSGRTTALVAIARDYLQIFPQAQIAFVAPVREMTNSIRDLFASKVNPRDLKRVSFMTPGNNKLTAAFDAFFVDNADFMPNDMMDYMHQRNERKLSSLYQTITTKEG